MTENLKNSLIEVTNYFAQGKRYTLDVADISSLWVQQHDGTRLTSVKIKTSNGAEHQATGTIEDVNSVLEKSGLQTCFAQQSGAANGHIYTLVEGHINVHVSSESSDLAVVKVSGFDEEFYPVDDHSVPMTQAELAEYFSPNLA